MFYFDNAATSYPKPEEVYSFSDRYYREYGFNAKRSHIKKIEGIHPNKLINDTKEMLLELFNAEEKILSFLSSATEAMNVVLQGLDYSHISNVYITPFEHNTVLRILHYLRGIYNFNIIELAMDVVNDLYDIENIKYQFQKDEPDLLIVNHASNVTGLIAPIKELCTMAKNFKAVTVIDIAQSAGQIEVDLGGNTYDFAIFAGHKSLMASFGVGGFISSGNTRLMPLIFGGTGFDSSNPDLPLKEPERYEVGSTNILAISSLYAALKYMNKCGIKQLFDKKKKMDKLLEILGEYPDIKIYRSKTHDNYTEVVSFNYLGYSSDSIGEIMARRQIIVRTGLHCAPNAHKYLGTFPEGTVRLSIGSFTSDEDFNALEKALEFIEENS